MLKKISGYKYLIEKSGAMRVPGIIYSSEKMVGAIEQDAINQVMNVATLPGIEMYSLAMPDIHSGYGFPIGGVAAFNYDEGIISPGGVGYDINCGVRVLRTNLLYEDIKGKIDELATALFNAVPAGVGSTGEVVVKNRDMDNVLKKGAGWAVANGFGESDDLENIEEHGMMAYDASAGDISIGAYESGAEELGTLGAGNHFLEVQRVDKIFDPVAADAFGIYEGQVTVMVHTGSRGFGYKVCEEYLQQFKKYAPSYGLVLPDMQLACMPLKSPEGRRYLNAMSGAANFAWANRQVITAMARRAFEHVFKTQYRNLGMNLIYDVSHNIARMEEHETPGGKKTLCVHRKGATRSYPAGHPALPEEFAGTGHPVLIPGDMGRASYILTGLPGSKESFYSSSHGAGRLMSRHAAMKIGRGRDIVDELKKNGIIVRVKNRRTIAEEASYAYKDVEDVTETAENAGLAKRVARLRPLAVVKG